MASSLIIEQSASSENGPLSLLTLFFSEKYAMFVYWAFWLYSSIPAVNLFIGYFLLNKVYLLAVIQIFINRFTDNYKDLWSVNEIIYISSWEWEHMPRAPPREWVNQGD